MFVIAISQMCAVIEESFECHFVSKMIYMLRCGSFISDGKGHAGIASEVWHQ